MYIYIGILRKFSHYVKIFQIFKGAKKSIAPQRKNYILFWITEKISDERFVIRFVLSQW